MAHNDSYVKVFDEVNFSYQLAYRLLGNKEERPVIWITACSHGDEIGSWFVVNKFYETLQKRSIAKGCVHSFPMMNPGGVFVNSRYMLHSPEDLNRSFPGDPNGSLAQRVAGRIFNEITSTKPDMVLDIHNDWQYSIPYIILEPEPEGKYKNQVYESSYESSKSVCTEIGLPVIQERKAVEGSLTLSLLNAGIPALTLELIGSDDPGDNNLNSGIRTIFNLLRYFGITRQKKQQVYNFPDKLDTKALDYSEEPVTSKNGIIHNLVEPGEWVDKGQPVAQVLDPFGNSLETLVAQSHSIVLGVSDKRSVIPGMSVMTFGVPK